MSRIDEMIKEFQDVVSNPGKQMKAYKDQGKKLIGIVPYYAPEELVYALDMVPVGLWGSNDKTVTLAKEYFLTFYCSLVQLDMEMGLDGTLDILDGMITPTCCDTLRPASQNFRVALDEKLHKFPVIFLAHPQNRVPEYGIKYCMDQYNNVREALEKIAGKKLDKEALKNAIHVYNKSRQARRAFNELAKDHLDICTPTVRCAVLKAAYFLKKDEYTAKLEELNAELAKAPKCDWKGTKVIVSGIICDNPDLLKVFEDYNIAIVADDVAQWTRSFRTDAPETDDPMRDLAVQFSHQDYDTILFDEKSNENRRGEHVAKLATDNGAQGAVVFITQFCDPEEMEYPYLKKALDQANVPHVKLGLDMQMRDFGQVRTSLQAFADVLEMRK
jgi:bcr-type benzoyl-CoA reductase subunit C